jgi:hypothetical protein
MSTEYYFTMTWTSHHRETHYTVQLTRHSSAEGVCVSSVHEGKSVAERTNTSKGREEHLQASWSCHHEAVIKGV